MPDRALASLRRIAGSSYGFIRARTPLACAGQRIGVMGGSFNPPHAGHANVAVTALKSLALDRVWWLVTPGNPLKSARPMPSQSARMAAARALVSDPRIVVTGFESELGTSYTAATLAFLVSRHPSARFVWIMGADSLAGFHQWRSWHEIADLVPIAVVDRPGWKLQALASPAGRTFARWRIDPYRTDLLAPRSKPGWAMLGTRLSYLSSTDLRSRSHRSEAVHVPEPQH